MPIVQDKVSIIIPLYNRAQYIEETIQSALSQTYPNIEILVIDDGSTDNSLNVIKRFEQNGQITIYQHENGVNKGQSAALNLGLQHASGEFIQILDSDDIILPEKLEKQINYFRSNPSIGLVYGRGHAVNEHGEYLYDVLSPSHIENSNPNDILLDCYFLLQGALIRHDVLKNLNGFDETLRAAQDHDMMIRLFEITKVSFQPDLVFLYRRHGDSISSKGSETRWRCGRIILKNAASRFPYQASTIRKRSAILHFRLAQALIKSKKNYFEAFYHIALSAILDPIRAIKVITKIEKVS